MSVIVSKILFTPFFCVLFRGSSLLPSACLEHPVRIDLRLAFPSRLCQVGGVV
jgi:hypothetical protein